MEAAYVGALTDGEGYVYLRENGTGTLHISNSDAELISALLRATGVGTIKGYQPTGGGSVKKGTSYKMQFVWALSKTPDLRAVLQQIQVFSTKAQRLLAHIEPTYQSWVARREARRQFCEDCGKEVSPQSRKIRWCPSCKMRHR